MEIKPIKTEQDDEAALREVDRLWDAEPGTPEADRLDVLVTLVEAYEREHYELPPPEPIAAIEYFMESRGWTTKDLAILVGNQHKAEELLARTRPLTLTMIRNLERAMGIPATILIQPYKTRTRVTSSHSSQSLPQAR